MSLLQQTLLRIYIYHSLAFLAFVNEALVKEVSSGSTLYKNEDKNSKIAKL